MTEYLSIEEALSKGCYVGPTRGVSMKPMLKEGRDSIVVYPKTQRLAPLDVALYRCGDSYVLHRVISVSEGGYLMRGDNTYVDERVVEEQVIGILTEYFRGEQQISCADEKYLKYVQKRQKSYPMRLFWANLKGKIKAIFKK